MTRARYCVIRTSNNSIDQADSRVDRNGLMMKLFHKACVME